MQMMKKINQKGFSLTELLVVIVIIIVLAGFTIGALPGIYSRINRSNTEVFIEELESGISRYQIEYGNYPLNEPSGNDPQARETSGVLGASILYKALSGDSDDDGEVNENEKVFVDKLAGKYNLTLKTKRTIGNPSGGGYLIVDPFNSPIRYLAEKPNKQGKKLTMNPTYDIWSIVDTNPGDLSEKNQSKYITNWKRN
jgi:prepilin-type N-terminal cleavage/methylation domain-containing protein